MSSVDRTHVPLTPVLLAAGALAAESATQLADFGWGLHSRLLDSSYEWSWSHLAATAAFATGLVLCARGARGARERRAAWSVATGAFAVLLADNVTRLHEHVPHWPVLFAPLLAALCGALLVVSAGTLQQPLVRLGVGLLVLSLGIHVLGPGVVHALGWNDKSWGYQIKVALKEGTELAGWVLLVPALWRLVRDQAA